MESTDGNAGRRVELGVASKTDYLARWVAYLVNPLILPPLLFGSILMQFDAPAAEVGIVVASSLILLTLLPFLLLGWMVRVGRATSFDGFDREQRRLPFVFGIACAALTAIDLVYLVNTARPVVLAVGACVVTGAVVLGLINFWWKVSVHSAAAGGFVAVFGFTSYLSGSLDEPLQTMLLLTVLPLVMWARVRTRSHTAGEVVAGATLGVVIPLLELLALHQLGLLNAT